MTTPLDRPAYALALSPAERARYRLMAEHARAEEAGTWASAGIHAGAAVADVGCGPGAVLELLAEAVGPDGRAAGVDADPGAVAAAAHQLAGLAHAEVHVGDAAATGLPAAAFDVVMCRHVLAHNGGREAGIVAHLAELVRPGGAVYLVDIDASMVWTSPADPDVADLDDRYRQFHAGRGNDIAIGRRLGDLLEAADLEVETFRCGGPVLRLPAGLRSPAWAARAALVEAGLAGIDDLARWDAALHRVAGLPVAPWTGLPLFTAVGRRAA